MEALGVAPHITQHALTPERGGLFSAERVAIARKVAKIAAVVIISVGLAYASPTLFAMGFFLGVVARPQVDQALDKLVNVYRYNAVPVLVTIAAGAFMCAAATLTIGAAVMGSYVGTLVKINPPEPEPVLEV